MALADAVRNPYVEQRFFVYVDGTDVAAFGMRLVEPPNVDESFGRFCATCELRFNFVAEQVRIGARVQVVESLDGYLSAIFTGDIMRPAGTRWPPRNTIWCNDVLWPTLFPATEEMTFENMDDAAVIVALLEAKGITTHNITSSNWTLGTLYPIRLTAQNTVAQLIQDIDAVAGCYTLASGSGVVYRLPLPLYPGAPGFAAHAFAPDPGPTQYRVYSAEILGDGIEQVRNQVEVTGARLTLRYDADGSDTLETGFAYGTPIDLSQVPLPGTVTVRDDSGLITFVEGVDYTLASVGDPPVGTITVIDQRPGAGIEDVLHTPVSILYDYTQEEAGGQITATAAADNAYLEPGVRLILPVSSSFNLIQDFTQAALIAEDKLAENNRLARRLPLTIDSNPAVRIGQTLVYGPDLAPTVRLAEATSFLITGIKRQGRRMSLETIGGDGGAVDYLDPRAPIADFDYVVVRAGYAVYVWLDAERAWDPDGDIASYAWSDDRSNTASGVRAGFVYLLVDGTPVSISLTVTDSTGLTSQVLTRTINLEGSQSDINAARYLYVRAVWYDSLRRFTTGPSGTVSATYGSPVVENPLSRYHGPLWRLMDQEGRVAPAYPTYAFPTNETYAVSTDQARSYTSWLSSRGLLVHQDGDDVALDILDVSGFLIPDSLGGELLEGYELPEPVVGLTGLEWVWYHPSEPDTWRVVTQSHILGSSRGENARELLASAPYGATWRGMAATAFDQAYVLNTTSTTPIVMSDGSQPVFPASIEVRDIGGWYTSSRYIVNCRYILELVDGEWTVRADEIEYDGYIEPQSGIDPPVPVDDRVSASDAARWRAIPYPAVDDLFFLGGGRGADDDGSGLVRDLGTYLYALTSDGSPARQVAAFYDTLNRRPPHMPSVAGPSVAPIEAVTVISDDTMLVLASDTEPVGWRDVDYDDSGWSLAVELGD